MSIPFKRLGLAMGAIAGAIATFAALPVVTAQDAAAPTAGSVEAPADQGASSPVASDAVVATVGGDPITEADLVFAAEDLADQLAQIPPEEQRAFLLTVLIDVKLMAAAARAQGMADDPVFQQRIDYLEEQALRRQYITDVVAGGINLEAVQARYDELAAEISNEEEIRARHILVATEEEAQALKAELDGGADFATLANENSTDASAANGGDLGFFGRGMMVQPFEEAAFALEAGGVSEPVQSQFGWHLIKIEERRQASAPPLEQVGQQIQQQLFIEAYTDAIDGLTAGADIQIPDAALASQVQAQQGQGDEMPTEDTPAQ